MPEEYAEPSLVPQTQPDHDWFDAHLDLAYLALTGRDMFAPLASCGGPHPPPAVTLRSLREGCVTECMATIFTELGGNEPGVGYPAEDARAAHAAGLAQLRVYQEWEARGAIEIVRARTKDGAAHGSKAAQDAAHAPLRVRILMECADPIRDPSELAWWAAQGVCAIGLAWARGSRYAGGNLETRGLSPAGRELVREADRLGIVHDASHLSDAAMDELFALSGAPVIASHSNCRSVLDPLATLSLAQSQRHLRDDSIQEIVERRGMIGLNLYSPFLRRVGKPKDERPTIDDAVDHLEHLCSLVAMTDHIGLGSDMDGGFGADGLPLGIDVPSGLNLLPKRMHERGWRDADIKKFRRQNWDAFWRNASASGC